MVSPPPKTFDTQLDIFLSTVYKAINTLESTVNSSVKPADGWTLSDLAAPVSEVISDKRDLIDIVAQYDDAVNLVNALDGQQQALSTAVARLATLDGYNEKFTQVQEWWDQNYPRILEVERLLELMQQIEPLNEQSKKLLEDMQVTKQTVADLEVSARNSRTEAKKSQDAAATSAANAGVSASKALISEQNAKASEERAGEHQLAASQSEANADQDAKDAAASEESARTSEQNAQRHEENSLTNANNAKLSEDNAKVSEDNAKLSEENSLTNANNAKVSEDKAKRSEDNAKLSEENAKLSETKVVAADENFSAKLASGQEIVDNLAGVTDSFADTKATVQADAERAESAATRSEAAAAEAVGEVDRRFLEIKGDAPEAWDTFAEIAQSLATNEETHAAILSAIASKADSSDLALYALQSDLNAKASKTELTSALTKKADITYVDGKVDEKVDKTSLDSLISSSTLAGEVSSLEWRTPKIEVVSARPYWPDAETVYLVTG